MSAYNQDRLVLAVLFILIALAAAWWAWGIAEDQSEADVIDGPWKEVS